MTRPSPEEVVLASRLTLLDELRQAEIRATSSQVALVIGHMIGTPLNVIVGRAALLRADPTPERMEDNARRIEEQAQRLTLRVRRLIQYLTAPEPEHETRPLAAVIDDALALYGPIAEQYRVMLATPSSVPSDAAVEGTPTLIVLSILLSLAIRTALEGQVVKLEVPSASDDDHLVLSVHLPGMKPPEGRIDRMEPPETYSVNNIEHEQQLSVCAAIAKRNGGQLELMPETDEPGITIKFHCAAA